MKGKPKEKALLRSSVVKVEQTNSARRLQKDLKELEDQEVPIVGVSARPLSNSIYTWHGNLRGPEGTPFEGGVFHIEIVFPMNYPIDPPAIKLFTPVPHPNVFGTTICLDILDKSNRQIYQGWTTAYTVSTILLQLQSFLFEQIPTDVEKKSKIVCKEAVRLANSFQCPSPDCNHMGPIKPYPPFNTKEKDLDKFFMVKTPRELLEEEFRCFHTKLHLKDQTLGIGVSINRLPRTGEIRMVVPTLDLLSMRAYVKHKVRYSLSNEKFTHWLPLYFGEQYKFDLNRKVYNQATKQWDDSVVHVDTRDRCINFIKKSLAFMTTGSTRKPFTASMILEVMPKLMITHVADMIQEVRHISIVSLRRLFNFLRLFRLLLDLYPEAEKQMDEKIEEFINHPEKRIKDHCGSLGDLLSMIALSKKHKMSEILELYLDEQLDRQVFWILREIPELDFEDPKYKNKELVLEEQRSEVSFKTGISGFHITLFYFQLCKDILEPGSKDLAKLCDTLDANFGCLPEKVEIDFQKKCQHIQTIKSFYQYYPMLGVAMPDQKTLKEKLNKAISNSRKKKYHGYETEINELPKLAVQAKAFLLDSCDPFIYYDSSKKEFLDAKDPKWKKACMD